MTPTPAARAWLDLMEPFADLEDVRQWLGEHGAFECYRRGVRDIADRATWPIVAAVLADLLGDPVDVIEGVALV